MTTNIARGIAVACSMMMVLVAGCHSDPCNLYGTCGNGPAKPTSWPDLGYDAVSDLVSDHGLNKPEVPLSEVSSPKPWHYPPDATKQQIAALDRLNAYRLASSVAPVDEHEALNAAAQSHAEFIVNHCQDYKNSGLSVHQENSDWSGFTGVNVWNRVSHFGYSSSGVAEVIGFVNNPEAAVDGWIGTLYHRLPLLDPATMEVGYGNSGIGGGTCNYPLYKQADVMDVGMGFVAEDAVVVYPPDGAKGVPGSFNGYESPQPQKPPGGFPSGTIITVQFGKPIGFEVQGHHLLENGTDPVEHLFLAPFADDLHDVLKDPNASFADNNVTMYAYKPLKSKTTYRAIIDLLRGGKPLHVETTFTTQ
ncbi:MAG: hypothetical protein GXP54_05945 [Deltaproteobacteria bacterium]|nr:hypothetical protein [Deltaproteobacteria bacterium]